MNSSIISTETRQPPVHHVPSSTSVDRIRLIRRSVRCLLFGLFGLVPVIGVPLAILALRLHAKVVAETGEIWQPTRLHIVLVTGLVVMIGVDVAMHFPIPLLIFAVVLGFLTFKLVRHCRTSAPAEWNPARQQLYWGVGFAYAGLLGTILCVAAGLNRLISSIIE